MSARGRRENPPMSARGRRGHALMELVIALPLLAVGGAAITGIMLTGERLTLEAERRLEVATRGPYLLDSLRHAAAGSPAEGSFEALDRAIGWSWDGRGTLELHDVTGMEGAAGGLWVLRADPSRDAGAPAGGAEP